MNENRRLVSSKIRRPDRERSVTLDGVPPRRREGSLFGHVWGKYMAEMYRYKQQAVSGHRCTTVSADFASHRGGKDQETVHFEIIIVAPAPPISRAYSTGIGVPARPAIAPGLLEHYRIVMFNERTNWWARGSRFKFPQREERRGDYYQTGW